MRDINRSERTVFTPSQSAIFEEFHKSGIIGCTERNVAVLTHNDLTIHIGFSDTETGGIRDFLAFYPGRIEEELEPIQTALSDSERPFETALTVLTSRPYPNQCLRSVLGKFANLDSTGNDVFTRFSGEFINLHLGIVRH